jgi:hypothetical protein
MFASQILKQSFVEPVRNDIIEDHARGHIIDGKHWKYVQQPHRLRCIGDIAL